MKRLWLVRHAKSSWKFSGLDDFKRPLNGRGRRDVSLMGNRLKELGVQPDVIVASPALRASETARSLAVSLGMPMEYVRKGPQIYEASVSGLLAIIRGCEDRWSKVMLVGHNPSIADIAGILTGKSVGHVPTCTVIELGLDVASWSSVTPCCGVMRFRCSPKGL